MNDITILNDEIKDITGIGAKKIKLDGKKLEAIKEKMPIVEPAIEKNNIEEIDDVEDMVNLVEDFAPKMEERYSEHTEYADSAYKATKKEESIDLEPIKALESAYKGHKSIVESRETQEMKEELGEEVTITEEAFVSELNKGDFSPKTSKYKEKIRNKYNVLKSKMDDQKQKIDSITKEYAKESELGNNLKEDKKYIQKVLSGVNDWNMDFLTRVKDDPRTQNLLVAIESYFASFRKDLEEKVRAEKACESKKEFLGKSEQEAREELIGFKKELNEFIQDNYKTLKSVNDHDDVLRKNNEELDSLTGYKEEPSLQSLHLNSERYAETEAKVEDKAEPEIPQANFGPAKPNIFDVLKQSTASVEQTPLVDTVGTEHRQVVTDISYNNPEENYSFRRAA